MPGIDTRAPERTDTSSGRLRVAQREPGILLQPGEVLEDLLPQPFRPLVSSPVVVRPTLAW